MASLKNIMNNFLLPCVFLFVFSAWADSTEVGGNFEKSSIDSNHLITIHSKFWGNYQCEGQVLTVKDFKRLYAPSSDKELLRDYQTSRWIKWGGYFGILAIATTVTLTTDAQFTIELPIYISSLIPYLIGSNMLKSTIKRYNNSVTKNTEQ
jgi:hypothetical protein